MSARQGTSSNRPPPLSVRKKLLFCLITCLLVFSSIEITWRLANGWNQDWVDCHRYDPVLGWCLREGWTGVSEWTAGLGHVNLQGLRDDRPVGPRPPGEKRLLILGDSITFGGKVRIDQTYPSLLERKFNQAGLPWRVLNGGVASYDPAQEVDWLERIGWSLEPDILAIEFCRNDVSPSDRSTRSQGKAGELPSGVLGRWLTDHSILAYKLQRGMWHLQLEVGKVLGVQPTVTADAGPDGTPAGWTFVENNYRRLAQTAREHHVPVMVIVFPTLDVAAGRYQDGLSQHLQTLGQELGWPVIDLEETFRSDPSSLFLEGDHIHPNPAGYERTAERLFQEFTSQGLLTTGPAAAAKTARPEQEIRR